MEEVKKKSACTLFDLWQDKECAYVEYCHTPKDKYAKYAYEKCSHDYFKACDLFVGIGIFSEEEIDDMVYEWRYKK